MSYRDQLRPILANDEGVKNKPYRDTAGKLTVGIGRNLDDVGVSSDEIALMLDNDINRAEAGARRLVPGFDGLTDPRKCAVVSMVFNLGEAKLKTFTITLGCINAGQWAAAALGMRASLWAKQVGARAERLAKMMEQG
jgi:lysozyme